MKTENVKVNDDVVMLRRGMELILFEGMKKLFVNNNSQFFLDALEKIMSYDGYKVTRSPQVDLEIGDKIYYAKDRALDILEGDKVIFGFNMKDKEMIYNPYDLMLQSDFETNVKAEFNSILIEDERQQKCNQIKKRVEYYVVNGIVEEDKDYIF